MQTLGESQNGEKRICHRLITFIGQDRPYRPLDLIELRGTGIAQRMQKEMFTGASPSGQDDSIH
jgi:hypothetical protein